jgi:hypothetical protein
MSNAIRDDYEYALVRAVVFCSMIVDTLHFSPFLAEDDSIHSN